MMETCMPGYDLITVGTGNVDKTGFFCYMSKRKEPGYMQKRAWLEERFAEGLTIKIIHEHGGRDTAFIEYIPGEYAWRAVYAPDYLVIHCLWVVGKGKGKGYGTALLDACLEDTRLRDKAGVVMVTSDHTWLAGSQVFIQNGFMEVGQAPPCFHLLVKNVRPGMVPSFPVDWVERQRAFGEGMTVVRTNQCPYNENAARGVVQLAGQRGIPARVVELTSAGEVQERAPCAYGTFAVVYDGRLFSYTYMCDADFVKNMTLWEAENGNA